MKNFLFILVSASFISSAFAQQAEVLLTKDLLTSAKVLQNDIHIFNYFTLEKVWPELESAAGREAFVQRYLSQRAGSFWDFDFTDSSTKNYAAGAGLYFAIDPLISKTYGNSFIELVIPKGTRIINVVNPILLKKATQAALIAEGYLQPEDLIELFPKQNGFYRDTLRAMVDAKFLKFRKLVQNIFSTESIQFVEYNFNSSLNSFCTKHSYSAFAFVGKVNQSNSKTAVMDESFSNVSMFSTELEFPNQTSNELETRAHILKFRTTLEQIATTTLPSSQIKKQIILKNYTPEAYQQEKIQTFSCE